MFSRLHYSLTREIYRWKSRFLENNLKKYNNYLRGKKSSKDGSKKVYVCGLGYEWFLTSTLGQNYSYDLVGTPEEAEYIFFITKIEHSDRIIGKKVYLFFSEPKDYHSHFIDKTEQDFFNKNDVTIISHFKNCEDIVKAKNVNYIRAYAYYHFHHWATEQTIRTLHNSNRKYQIFSLTSGLKGIAGNLKRKEFIKKFSEANKKFHFYGRFSKEAYSLPNYKGLCAFKWELLKSYKYNLILENSPSESWYISEKIFDALICGCMPIYHGTEKIFEVLPREWFYYLPNLDLDEIQKLNDFLNTDAYLRVANSQPEIAEYVNQKFSFYAAVESIVSGNPLDCAITDS